MCYWIVFKFVDIVDIMLDGEKWIVFEVNLVVVELFVGGMGNLIKKFVCELFVWLDRD